MKFNRGVALLASVAMLSGCGGGGGGGDTFAANPGTPAPVVTAPATCSLRARQDFVLAQMREWYLFPETLPASLDAGGFTIVDTYLDALTATARSQRRDRFFS